MSAILPAPLLLKDALIVGQGSDLKQAGFGKTSRQWFTKNLQRRATGMLGLNRI
ncbi:MAG: hypothetical protein GWP56_17275 [Gammaproteobacteria bacterium]|jgi:hypothetical protein|nr:hypothetical protein [Gammaproteobacteria bacterium]